MEQKEQVSNFEDLYVVELEREKTLVIKKITNDNICCYLWEFIAYPPSFASDPQKKAGTQTHNI